MLSTGETDILGCVCRFVRIHDTASKQLKAQVYVKQALNAVCLYDGPLLPPLPSKLPKEPVEAADQGPEGEATEVTAGKAARRRQPRKQGSDDEAVPASAGRQRLRDDKKRPHSRNPRSGRIQRVKAK